MANKPPIKQKMFTPQQLKEAYDNYEAEQHSKNKWADRQGFLISKKLYKDLFNEYAKDKAYSGVLEDIEYRSQQSLLERGLTGQFNPTLVKFALSAKHGWAEKTEQVNKHEGALPVALVKYSDEE